MENNKKEERMSDLNGTGWPPTKHKVKAQSRNWDVLVRLNVGTEKFECVCPALPDCMNVGITPPDALAGMEKAIEDYIKAGRGGFKNFNGPSIKFN